jgi:hypothetical protein
MALFIRRFSKLMGKQKFFKGDNKDKSKSKTKRACYNCGKYGHYIANCPYEEEKKELQERQSRAPPLLQASLSSPTSTKGSILASWQRRVRKR